MNWSSRTSAEVYAQAAKPVGGIEAVFVDDLASKRMAGITWVTGATLALCLAEHLKQQA